MNLLYRSELTRKQAFFCLAGDLGERCYSRQRKRQGWPAHDQPHSNCHRLFMVAPGLPSMFSCFLNKVRLPPYIRILIEVVPRLSDGFRWTVPNHYIAINTLWPPRVVLSTV